jgi:glycosyltransferase involved in cell wall biosynthesis
VIPNGLDTQTYKPVNKTFAREVLNLPQDKKLILYGSAPRINDINKGFSHLCGALQELRGRKVGTQSELVIFGSSGLDVQAAIEMRVNVVGKVLDDATLALLYSAADVTCVPSITEAFGQTASESMACGTPVVAFRTSGLTDVVDHEDNGYLAAPFESSDLARGIEWVLEDEVRWKRLSENARHKAINVFNVGEVARRYASLYEEILRVQE